MNSFDRFTAAIEGTCKNPPVVIPYLQYYYPEIVDQITPFSRKDLEEGDLGVKIEALSLLHQYFDCDWIRAITDPVWAMLQYTDRASGPDREIIPAERLLEDGVFDVATELVRRFGQEKFVYGRVGIPYGALFADWEDIAGAMIALKKEPDRCKAIIEDSIPQRLEEIRAWAQTGVHGLWLGQWLCSNDMISEADYLNFVYPYDKIIVDAVHDAGLKSIFHFCGDIIPRLKHIKRMGPVIFGAEESKKGFEVEVGQVRAELGNDVCLLGNIDVYDVVERGTPDEWAREVERQITNAGPERFVVSCGSPITFDTPPQRLREFIVTAQGVRDSLN
jgi:hypothetical protein